MTFPCRPGRAMSIIVATLCASGTSAQTAPPQVDREWTLEGVLKSALAQHPLVEAAQARVAAAQGGRVTAGTFPNPVGTLWVENATFPGQRQVPGVTRETSTYFTLPLEPCSSARRGVRSADETVKAAGADLGRRASSGRIGRGTRVLSRRRRAGEPRCGRRAPRRSRGARLVQPQPCEHRCDRRARTAPGRGRTRTRREATLHSRGSMPRAAGPNCARSWRQGRPLTRGIHPARHGACAGVRRAGHRAVAGVPDLLARAREQRPEIVAARAARRRRRRDFVSTHARHPPPRGHSRLQAGRRRQHDDCRHQRPASCSIETRERFSAPRMSREVDPVHLAGVHDELVVEKRPEGTETARARRSGRRRRAGP